MYIYTYIHIYVHTCICIYMYNQAITAMKTKINRKVLTVPTVISIMTVRKVMTMIMLVR
jgi:hypothetical protein